MLGCSVGSSSSEPPWAVNTLEQGAFKKKKKNTHESVGRFFARLRFFGLFFGTDFFVCF
jgi:hypothetical protein